MSDDDFLREIQDSFLLEAQENLAQTESLFMSLEKQGLDHSETFIQLKRLAHNFKGSGKAVGFDDLSSFSHSMENLLIALSTGSVELTSEVIDLLLACNDALKESVVSLLRDKSTQMNHGDLIQTIEAVIALRANPEDSNLDEQVEGDTPVLQKPMLKHRSKPKPNTSTPVLSPVDDHIRLPMKRIEDLFNSFGEQVIYLSALDHLLDNIEANKDDVVRTIFNLKKITFDLQQYTLSLRMVNLKNIFGKLERSIRDSAKATDKKVKYEFVGTEQELDKMIVDQISDPLNHMVRNAVDHGLETTAERIIAGKSEEGHVWVRAFREAGSFIIEIEDDGKGMDPAKIRKKAIEKGLISADQDLNEKETFDLIFENGFSTKDQVSEISGRGVGMNVVKETVQALNGSYEIRSTLEKGTLFRLKLPLTLSLYNGLCFTVYDSKYIIPSSQISEVVDSDEVQIRDVVGGEQVVQIRNEVYRLLDIRSVLKHPDSVESDSRKKRDMILVSHVENEIVCFRIHQIIGMIKVVQKPLNPEMHTCPGAVGVTILGDGNPVLILDLRVLKSEIKNLRRKIS